MGRTAPEAVWTMSQQLNGFARVQLMSSEVITASELRRIRDAIGGVGSPKRFKRAFEGKAMRLNLNCLVLGGFQLNFFSL